MIYRYNQGQNYVASLQTSFREHRYKLRLYIIIANDALRNISCRESVYVRYSKKYTIPTVGFSRLDQ